MFGADVRTEAATGSGGWRRLPVAALDQRSRCARASCTTAPLRTEGRPPRRHRRGARRVGHARFGPRNGVSPVGRPQAGADIAKVPMTASVAAASLGADHAPSPGVRRDFWRDLASIDASDSTTIVHTTQPALTKRPQPIMVFIWTADDSLSTARRRRRPTVGGDVDPAGGRRPGRSRSRITPRLSGRGHGGRRRGPRRARRADTFVAALVESFTMRFVAHFCWPTLEDVSSSSSRAGDRMTPAAFTLWQPRSSVFPTAEPRHRRHRVAGTLLTSAWLRLCQSFRPAAFLLLNDGAL